MNDNKNTTEDTTVKIEKEIDQEYTVKMEKVVDQDYTIMMETVVDQDYTVKMEKVIEQDIATKIEKVIEKDAKWNMFKDLVGKYITTCAKKVGESTIICAKEVGKYTTICVNKVGKYTTICAKEVGKYTAILAKKVGESTTTCAKKISETKFAVIMDAKYSEVYGEVHKALMKIVCRLAGKNETKGVKAVEDLKGLDEAGTTLKAKAVTIEKINTFFVLIFKKIVALVKCVAMFTLNAITILGILVARVVYYTAKEIIYASKEIVLCFYKK